MKDYLASIQKLRADAAEAASIRDRSVDNDKQQMYDRLHKHLSRLADEVETAVNGLRPTNGVS